MLYVTTSWDDGHALDLKLAELLGRYGIRGTFYISKEYVHPRLSEVEIALLAGQQEVGAHTLTHPNLTTLTDEEALAEMRGGKEWLESVLGKEVPTFCYPAGHHDMRIAHLAREAGYVGARTTVSGITAIPQNSFLFGTTLQVYPFPLRRLDATHYYWGKLLQPFFERYASLRSLGVPLSAMTDWRAASLAAFKGSLATGGVFHLWGHSWEIERYGMWEDLEWLLSHIAEHKEEVRFVTNGEIIATFKPGTASS